MITISYSYWLWVSTMQIIIRDVCKTIWKCFMPVVISLPIQYEWKLKKTISITDICFQIVCLWLIINLLFYRPLPPKGHCVMTIRARSQLFHGQVSTDWIRGDVGGYGSTNDGGIFNAIAFNTYLTRGLLDILAAKHLPGDNDDYAIPYCICLGLDFSIENAWFFLFRD